MIKLTKILSALFLMAIVSSCSHKKSHGEQSSDLGEWKEMDSFHMIMAETFHPYKDSGNLEPLKTHIEVLTIEASKWKNADLPEKVNTDEIKSRLQQLETDALALAELVKTGTDQAVGASLDSLHNHFHQIQEAWYSDNDEHKHAHH